MYKPVPVVPHCIIYLSSSLFSSSWAAVTSYYYVLPAGGMCGTGIGRTDTVPPTANARAPRGGLMSCDHGIILKQAPAQIQECLNSARRSSNTRIS